MRAVSRWCRWFATLGVALSSVAPLSAPATTVASHTTAFDIARRDSAPDVWLTSSVEWQAGFALLRYELRYDLVDMLLDVKWLDQQGSTLLHGGNGFGFTNVAWSLDVEFVGFLAPVFTHVLLDGQADFSQTIGLQNLPCLSGRRCLAKYHDWAANAGGGGPPGPGNPGQRQPAGLTSPAPAALPEGLASTSATLSGHAAGSADAVPWLQATSHAVDLGGRWLYVYGLRNDGPVPLAVDVGVAGLQAEVAVGDTVELSVESALAPALRRTVLTLERDGGATFALRFDAIAPVPEPPAAWLALGGLMLLAPRLRRRVAAAARGAT
jgi:hypothetical protein